MSRYVAMVGGLVAVTGMIWIAAVTGTVASAAGDQLVVSVEPQQVSTAVGVATEVTVTVVNGASAMTPELAIHIDITDPRGKGSVDPEDWSSTLTYFRGATGPG